MSSHRSPSVVQTQDGADAVAPEEVVTALTAVLGSETFSATPRSRAFLAYIVTEHLAGRVDRLGEHAVARHALGRSAYDPRLDSAVRVQATRVRTALQRYYDAEGAGATIRFSLPPGRYAPTVARRDPGRTAPPAHDDVVVEVLRVGSTGSEGRISTTVCAAVADRLARFPGVTVVGPSAPATTGATGTSRPPCARLRLGIRVTSDGEDARLEAALVEACSGETAWRTMERIAMADLDGPGRDDRWAAAVAGQVGDSTGVIFRRTLSCDAHPGSVAHAARLAYADYLMQGTDESVRSAAYALDRALAPGAGAELLAMRGVIHNAEVDQGVAGTERARSLRSAERLARRALAMDPDSASAYLVLGGTACRRQQWDLAHRHATRAADLAPWSPTVLMSAGTVMAAAGDWKGGVETLREGFRLNPLHPGLAHSVSALACLVGGDDAGALAEASLVHVPGQLCGPLYRALALAALGYREQAWTEMAHVLEIDPAFLDDPASYFTDRARFAPCELETLLAHLIPFRAGPPV